MKMHACKHIRPIQKLAAAAAPNESDDGQVAASQYSIEVVGSLVAESRGPSGGDGVVDDDGLLRRAVAGHLDDEPLRVAQRGEDLVRDAPVVGGVHVVAVGVPGALDGQVADVAAAGDVGCCHHRGCRLAPAPAPTVVFDLT